MTTTGYVRTAASSSRGSSTDPGRRPGFLASFKEFLRHGLSGGGALYFTGTA